MALIDKETIRAEIERLIEMNKTKRGFPAGTYCAIRIDTYEHLLNFIDFLPEQPVEGLEEEIRRYLREECSGDDEPLVSEIARHFAEWGIEEGERQMMENAVDGRYMKADGKVYVESWPLDIEPDSVKAGDEVRLIVIPK